MRPKYFKFKKIVPKLDGDIFTDCTLMKTLCLAHISKQRIIFSTIIPLSQDLNSKYSSGRMASAAPLRKHVLFNLVTKESPDSARPRVLFPHKREGMKRKSGLSELLPNEKRLGVG